MTNKRMFGVYWRAKDGLGTHVWKERLTMAEAEAEIVWCEGAHSEAVMVWVLRGDDGSAFKVVERHI